MTENNLRKDYSFLLKGSGINERKGVLLVHGLTGAPPEMRSIGNQLNKQGFTVYAPMLAGHCQDEQTLVKMTFEDWVEGLRQSLNYLRKQGVDEIYAAGICVGGAIALHLAHSEYSNPLPIQKVVIYSIILDYDGWDQSWLNRLSYKFIEFFIKLPFFKNMRFPEKHPFGIKSDRIRKLALQAGGDQVEGMLPYFPIAGVYQNYRLNKALLKELPQIKVPVLLVHSIEDEVASVKNALKVQELHGGECDVAVIKDCYHLIHIDQERQKVGQLTASFFNLGSAHRENS